jgi:hypothetical protein
MNMRYFREERMRTWVFPFLALVFSISLMVPIVLAVNGPLVGNLQYKFCTGQNALFTALLNGDIDLMAWPLTYSEYQTAITTTNITVAPYFDTGYREIAFNNNATDPSHTADRKAMNYTEFRQAMACLVDKDGLVAGANVHGFGTRIDTQVSRPILNAWVNFNDSKYDANGNLLNNYPWDYNVTHALEILWTNDWYNHTTYQTLAGLLTAYTSGGNSLPAGSVVYPPGHPRAGSSIDTILAYVRSEDPPRREAGENLANQTRSIGISVYIHGPGIYYTPVFVNHDYDIYTSSWNLGRFPTHFYYMFTPAGIYPGGPNIYVVNDANLTYHATLEYLNATSSSQSMAEAMMCQDIIVQQAMSVALYSQASYIAYRTGVVGAINSRGCGLKANLNYIFMSAMVPPYNSLTTLKYGTLNPPEQINPVFHTWVWDCEAVESMFSGPMAVNPYNPSVLGKSPAGGDQPWMAYDWHFQLSTFNGGGGQGDPGQIYTNCANVTYWFRHDIAWQDGVPFTVDDFNYTIHIDKSYSDSWAYADMAHVVSFVKWDNWTCSLYFDTPSYYSLYEADYCIVPEHVYSYIAIPADAQTGTSTTGLHGYWPGANALSSEVLEGAPFTYSQLVGVGGEQYTWVGTGMWKYVPGTLAQGDSGGLSCVPHGGFWTNMTQGDVDFRYTWNAGSAPQGGSYSIGLSDLVLLANAYGTSGNGHAVPFQLGGLHVWEPGCDIAPPAGTVGLSDLVMLALNYGKTWGSNP